MNGWGWRWLCEGADSSSLSCFDEFNPDASDCGRSFCFVFPGPLKPKESASPCPHPSDGLRRFAARCAHTHPEPRDTTLLPLWSRLCATSGAKTHDLQRLLVSQLSSSHPQIFVPNSRSSDCDAWTSPGSASAAGSPLLSQLVVTSRYFRSTLWSCCVGPGRVERLLPSGLVTRCRSRAAQPEPSRGGPTPAPARLYDLWSLGPSTANPT